MKTKKRNSKKWLECRRDLVSDYRTWQILCVVKILLFFLLMYSINRTLILNGGSKSAAFIGWFSLNLILLILLKEIQGTQGILPAPETTHSIKATIDEALKCKETGEEKTIVMNFSGHGMLDLKGYASYFEGTLQNAK